MRALKAFEVTIAGHLVPARRGAAGWVQTRVEAQTVEVSELDEQRAIEAACRSAHIVAGVPAWRPYLRESMTHARARRVTSSREQEMERVRRGGRA